MLENPVDAKRARPPCGTWRTLPAAFILFMVSGCGYGVPFFLVCPRVPYGYEVVGQLEDADGNPIQDVRIFATMRDETGAVFLNYSSREEFRSDEEGVFEAKMIDAYERCYGGILLDPALDPPPAPLPNPAFVELWLPYTDQRISVPVTEDMISRNPGELFDDLDLGVVIVPSE